MTDALDRRLAQWAARRRIDDRQLAQIRGAVLASAMSNDVLRDAAPGFDNDWLWSLLRPVTELIERTAEVAEIGVPRHLEKWLEPFAGDAPYRPYLQLA